MLNRAYTNALVYFILFSLLLLASGAVLFIEKIGFSYSAVAHYYLGNTDTFEAAKSYDGLLKIIVPHIFSFGLFVMVVLHFVIFTPYRNRKNIQIILYLSFLAAFLELFSPFMILLGLKFFVYIKIFSFFLFEALMLFILFLLFKSIIYTK